MMKKWNIQKMTVVFLLLLVFTVIGRPEPARAATLEIIELNQDYLVQLEGSSDSRLYQFTVPAAGNISIQAKNTDPTGNEKVCLQLFDSNNLALTDEWWDSNVELPVYSTDENRTFYLSFEPYENYSISYVLTVNFEPTTDWETEDNDTTVSADVITAGKSWYGAINDKNDSCDYFKFKLNVNKKVVITFGPKEVSGNSNSWDVELINSSNQSERMFSRCSTTQTYTCYLKKGTYYLRITNCDNSRNIPYAVSYRESALKLTAPVATSVKAVGHKGWNNYVTLDVKVKNSGNATGYVVKVSNKKNMGRPVTTEEIAFEGSNSKKQFSLKTDFTVSKSYYVQVKSYVTDPFGVKVYGKYGAVKGTSLSKALYKELKK